MAKVVIVGGARSGKSAYAESLSERLAEKRAAQLVYIATAQAFDDEMRERIAAHRDRRGAAWTCVEAPRDLGSALAAHARADRVILVDCLTLWLSNEMLAKEFSPDARPTLPETARSVFLAAFRDAPGAVICVTNEVGLGLVPETPLGRAFRDAQGRLNQDVAAAADYAAFVAAGLPLTLKGEPPA